jgi:hypothetical protein
VPVLGQATNSRRLVAHNDDSDVSSYPSTPMQLCSAGFASEFSVTAFHSRFTTLRVSRSRGECASPLHLKERNRTSTKPKLSKDLHDLDPSSPTVNVVSRERIAASPCTWLSHAPSTIPDKTPHRHPAGFPFHSTPPPACSDVPHARLGSSLALSPGFPLRASIAVDPTTMHPYGRNRWDLPSSSTYLFLHATA